MAGINVFKSAPLATGTRLFDSDAQFALRKGQALVHASIAVNAGSGPVEVNMWIYNEGDTSRPIILGEADFIRADNVFGAPDVWTYTGRTGYQDNSTLRLHVQNNSGSTVIWLASWRTEP